VVSVHLAEEDPDAAPGRGLDHPDELIADRLLELVPRLTDMVGRAARDQSPLRGREDLFEHHQRVIAMEVAASLGRAAAVQAGMEPDDLPR
jgi:hypothetical protein